MEKAIIDLTLPIHEGMPVFPVHWHPRVQVAQMGTFEGEQRQTKKVVLGTHTGTHCDAPSHFIVSGKSIDEIPLDVFVGSAMVLDFSQVPQFHEISQDELEVAIGDSRPDRVVFRYDWSDHWGTKIYYANHPFLSEQAARFLVSLGVKLVAMDTPMPDNPENGRGTKKDSVIHKILLGSGVVLVEYLCNLRSIQTRHIDLIVAPLKIQGGDGSPARCMAMERDDE